MQIPFHKPILPDNLDNIFPDSIKGGWLTTGPQVKEFESILSNYLGAKYVVAVNSCTAALHLVLQAKNFNSSDFFIAPTYTFVASVEVGEYLGMKPLLVDCDNNFNIDLNHVEHLLKTNKNIKCIIPVHFAGKPVDMKNILYLSEKYDLFVLEDAAHALEAKSNLGKVGDTFHACAFSFYANKNITTGGEGGAVATNDEKLASNIRKLSLHGMSKDGWNRFSLGGKWAYDVTELGYKYNMTDISATFGIWQLNRLNDWYSKRKKYYNLYKTFFASIDGVDSQENAFADEIHAHHLFLIYINPKKWNIDRNELINKLNSNGVGTSVHYTPVHMHSYYRKKYGFEFEDFPQAYKFSKNVLSLPLYPALKRSEINYIIDTFENIWNEHKA